jgi:hypothetical protein
MPSSSSTNQPNLEGWRLQTPGYRVKRPPGIQALACLMFSAGPSRKTWVDIRRSMHLQAVQGRGFEYEHGHWAHARIDGESRISRIQADKFLEDESRSLG